MIMQNVKLVTTQLTRFLLLLKVLFQIIKAEKFLKHFSTETGLVSFAKITLSLAVQVSLVTFSKNLL